MDVQSRELVTKFAWVHRRSAPPPFILSSNADPQQAASHSINFCRYHRHQNLPGNGSYPSGFRSKGPLLYPSTQLASTQFQKPLVIETSHIAFICYLKSPFHPGIPPWLCITTMENPGSNWSDLLASALVTHTPLPITATQGLSSTFLDANVSELR